MNKVQTLPETFSLEESSYETQTLYPGVDNSVLLNIFTDSVLSHNDRWLLARSCKNFYALLNAELKIKSKVYSFGVVPYGLLGAEIFKRYKPNFQALCDFFVRAKRILPTIHFDNHLEWPLAALMNMNEALEELLEDDPMATDGRGLRAIDYIVMSGDVEFLKRWVGKHVPDFSWEEEGVELLVFAMNCGNDEMVKFLMPYGKSFFNMIPESPESDVSALHEVIMCGFEVLFWELVDGGADLHRGASFPLTAAKYRRWGIYDKLIARGIELSEEDRAKVVCYAARDDHQRFRRLLETCEDVDFSDFCFEDGTVYSLACEGGQIETVDYIFEQKWFQVHSPCDTNRARGISIAALHGQLKLIQHLYEKHLTTLSIRDVNGKDAEDYAAMRGNWGEYCLLLDTYFNLRETPPAWSNLNDAVINGHLYFAQQFVMKYGIECLQNNQTLIKDAEASGNRVVVRWVNEQIEALKAPADQITQEVNFTLESPRTGL